MYAYYLVNGNRDITHFPLQYKTVKLVCVIYIYGYKFDALLLIMSKHSDTNKTTKKSAINSGSSEVKPAPAP